MTQSLYVHMNKGNKKKDRSQGITQIYLDQHSHFKGKTNYLMSIEINAKIY
jgi:hypothetical protein